MKLVSRFPLFVFRTAIVAILVGSSIGGIAVAQGSTESKAAQPSAAQAESNPPSRQPNQGLNQEFSGPLAEQSAKAAGEQPEAENAQEKMVAELKYSPSVRWMAEHLHISPSAGYWIGIFIDFAILALLIIFALKKNLPAMFRTRTQDIQRGILEAKRASEEANRRLAGIEARLAKLDEEIGAMRAAAEQEAAAEEQRILAAAEADKQRLVQTAEAEIAAAAKLARRELKAYAADLAVTLAERRIRVDATTDQALVRSFVNQLASANAGTNDGAGKDGK